MSVWQLISSLGASLLRSTMLILYAHIHSPNTHPLKNRHCTIDLVLLLIEQAVQITDLLFIGDRGKNLT